MPQNLTSALKLSTGSCGGVVVKLEEQEVRGSIPGLAATISETCYLLLPSRDMTERSLKRRKSLKRPTKPIKFSIQSTRE